MGNLTEVGQPTSDVLLPAQDTAMASDEVGAHSGKISISFKSEVIGTMVTSQQCVIEDACSSLNILGGQSTHICISDPCV